MSEIIFSFLPVGEVFSLCLTFLAFQMGIVPLPGMHTGT